MSTSHFATLGLLMGLLLPGTSLSATAEEHGPGEDPALPANRSTTVSAAPPTAADKATSSRAAAPNQADLEVTARAPTERPAGETSGGQEGTTGSVPGSIFEEAAVEPRVVWDASARTLSVHADQTSIDAFVAALEAQGVEIKTDESWQSERISAAFDDLPIGEATTKVFGTGFVLTWSPPGAAAQDATARPRIILLPFAGTDGGAAEAKAEDADAAVPYDDAALEKLAASSSAEELAPVLESALTKGNEALRAAALRLLGRDAQLKVAHALLRDVADLDESPAVRQMALGVLLGRVAPSSMEALLNGVDVTSAETTSPGRAPPLEQARPPGPFTPPDDDGADNDATGDDALTGEARTEKCQQFLSSLDQDEMNWLFKSHVPGVTQPRCS